MKRIGLKEAESMIFGLLAILYLKGLRPLTAWFCHKCPPAVLHLLVAVLVIVSGIVR